MPGPGITGNQVRRAPRYLCGRATAWNVALARAGRSSDKSASGTAEKEILVAYWYDL